MRGLYHFGKFTAQDFVIAKKEIEKCIEIDPENATAHTNLGMIHHNEDLLGWTRDQQNSEKLASHHTEVALELDPDNVLANTYMAEYLYCHHEYERSEFYADRAIELNPTASEGYMVKADLLVLSHRIDDAIPYADQSLQLDPHSIGAGWGAGCVYMLAGQYDRAIKTLRSISHPPDSVHAEIAASLIGKGSIDEARKEMRRYLKLAKKQIPNYPTTETEWRNRWRRSKPFKYDEDFDTFFDLLLQAGLCDEETTSADDLPSIAVLPFENMSGDPEQEYFSDGITNDIVTMLSHIRRLRVVARHSTLAYKEYKPSITDIAEEQGVRYILDGSVRKIGKRIRVNVQLIDSQTGENCWAENYDRDLKDIFAVQDEITKNIAVEMQVHLLSGDSARETSMGTRSIKAWELVSMAWDLQDSYIKDNMLKARRQVDKALQLDPEYSTAWVVLGWTHWQAAYVGFSESIDDSIREAENAVDKALSIDPENAEALALRGFCHVSRNAADLAVENCSKAVEISPGNAEVQALTAFVLVYAGEYDKALPHHEASLRLCPICPNWFQLIGGTIYQRTGDLDKAIAKFSKGIEIEPESPLCRYYLIDALMDAGREKEARACADEIRELDSAFSISGMLLSHSHNKDIREEFRANLEKVGFEEYRA
jgi:adenylate cyclase